jgi:hypothetical protein
LWVILGSYPEAATRLEEQMAQIMKAAERCGVRPFRDQSSNYEGFAPGYMILILAAQSERANSQHLLQQVRPCVRDAYVKHGRRLGEEQAQAR